MTSAKNPTSFSSGSVKSYKRPKIIEMKLKNQPAFCNKSTNQIVIDERLRDYPEVRNLIIRHEMGHIMEDKTPNDCLVRDMRDNPMLYLRKDYWDFMIKSGVEFTSYQDFITNIQMAYYHIMIAVFVAPLTFIIIGWVKIREKFK